MRKQTVDTSEAKTKKEAEIVCPWAAKIVKVEGGWMCFEDYSEYITWRKQK